MASTKQRFLPRRDSYHLLRDGGRGRTRTYEAVKQGIYSPPPLPLGTLSHIAPVVNNQPASGTGRTPRGVCRRVVTLSSAEAAPIVFHRKPLVVKRVIAAVFAHGPLGFPWPGVYGPACSVKGSDSDRHWKTLTAPCRHFPQSLCVTGLIGQLSCLAVWTGKIAKRRCRNCHSILLLATRHARN